MPIHQDEQDLLKYTLSRLPTSFRPGPFLARRVSTQHDFRSAFQEAFGGAEAMDLLMRDHKGPQVLEPIIKNNQVEGWI